MRCKNCHREVWWGRAHNQRLPDAYRDNQDYMSCYGSMIQMHFVELGEIEKKELAIIALS